MYLILNYHNGLNKDLLYIIEIGVAPFIIKDLFVVILSCLIYSRIKNIIYREEYHDILIDNN